MQNRPSGLLNLSITSFYGSHIINGAEWWMLCVNSYKMYKNALLLDLGVNSSLYRENSKKLKTVLILK